MAKKEVNPCPCGSSGAYERCCGRYIEGAEAAPTAEALMRSRYSAYVLKNEAYVKATWHPSTRPVEAAPEDGVKWLGLEVREHVPGGDEATVEFVARYKLGGRAYRMHEISRFVREEGKWFYVEGSFPG